MFIKELIKKPTLSFEVFPSSDKQTYSKVAATTSKVACLQPSYMSVTFGKSSAQADDLSKFLSHLTTVVPHLTCKLTISELDELLNKREAEGLENILALRGDQIPEGPDHFHHANELIHYIKQHWNFCVGAACYPEGHPEDTKERDNLFSTYQKQQAGADFLVTQMFFDNDTFYKFYDEATVTGTHIPIIPAIMPITSYKSYMRCRDTFGVKIPDKLQAMIAHYDMSDEAIYQVGLLHAQNQVLDLVTNGFKNIHLYIMNNPTLASDIVTRIKPIIK